MLFGPIDLLGYVFPDHPGSPSPDLLGGPGGLTERSSRISGRSCWTDRELLEDLLDALGFGRHTAEGVAEGTAEGAAEGPDSQAPSTAAPPPLSPSPDQ